jgi:hypothetical protein
MFSFHFISLHKFSPLALVSFLFCFHVHITEDILKTLNNPDANYSVTFLIILCELQRSRN